MRDNFLQRGFLNKLLAIYVKHISTPIFSLCFPCLSLQFVTLQLFPWSSRANHQEKQERRSWQRKTP